MMVINECSIKDDAAVGFEGACNHIGSVRGRPAVDGRSGPALGVRFDNKSAEVRNQPIDCVHFIVPPFHETRVKRIKRTQPSDNLGTAQINGYGNLNAPFAKCISDASELRQKIILKQAWISVDVVDGAAVDPDGSEQARVLADKCQVGANFPILEKVRTPAVSSFDSTVEIVPLVHPPKRSVGLLGFVQVNDIFVPCQ